MGLYSFNLFIFLDYTDMRELFSPELYPLALFTVSVLVIFLITAVGTIVECLEVISKELTPGIRFDVRKYLRLLSDRLGYIVLIALVYVVMCLFLDSYQGLVTSPGY